MRAARGQHKGSIRAARTTFKGYHAIKLAAEDDTGYTPGSQMFPAIMPPCFPHKRMQECHLACPAAVQSPQQLQLAASAPPLLGGMTRHV